VLALVFPFLTARAANECNLQYLKPVNDSFEEELRVKRVLLTSALNCAIEETVYLKKGLSAADVSDEELKKVRDVLLEDLDKAVGFYNEELQIVDELNIKDIQDVSRSIKEKRLSVFASEIQEALNLILWSGNQKFFRTADSRLEQIKKTLAVLKLDENKEIKNLLLKTEESFGAAKNSNTRVREALVKRSPEGAMVDIKESLKKLSETYGGFLKISEAVKKIVPY